MDNLSPNSWSEIPEPEIQFRNLPSSLDQMEIAFFLIWRTSCSQFFDFTPIGKIEPLALVELTPPPALGSDSRMQAALEE